MSYKKRNSADYYGSLPGGAFHCSLLCSYVVAFDLTKNENDVTYAYYVGTDLGFFPVGYW